MVKNASKNTPLPECCREGYYRGKFLQPSWIPGADTGLPKEKEVPEASSVPLHLQALGLRELPWRLAPCPWSPTPPLAPRAVSVQCPRLWLQAGPCSSLPPCQGPP